MMMKDMKIKYNLFFENQEMVFTHNFVTSFVKSSLRWCFLFSRCLIYKVHVPHAEQSLLYQAQFCLSRTFFRRFRPPSLDPLLFIAAKQLIKNSRISLCCQQLFLIFIISISNCSAHIQHTRKYSVQIRNSML